MTRVHQYYEGDGAPMQVPSSPQQVVDAWRSHRERMGSWLGDLDEAGWGGPTRCAGWTVTHLVQHLISGSQFLGYTLHQSRKGEATRLLQEFDAQQTPAATARLFAGFTPAQLCAELVEMDRRLDAELQAADEAAWRAPAEAPPGRVPAYVAVNHFLFDSWVHERDLMLPIGESPPTDADEGAVVASYVLALAGVARSAGEGPPAAMSIEVRLDDLDRVIAVDRRADRVTVRFGTAEDPQSRVAGATGEVVDAATGRVDPEALSGDAPATAYLRHLAEVMA
jgi:uncharacterized protein (TIGR03083 family)